MRRSLSLYFCAAALLLISSFADAFSSPDVTDDSYYNSLRHFVREAWTTRDGLPHNSVNAMVQDQSGYLWLGTWQGPTRFNGREFEIFDDIRVTGLPDIGIFTIALNPCNGSVYVGGARGGISRFDDGRWRELEAAPPFINHLYVDKQCNLWVSSSERGLLFYENDQRTAEFTTRHGLPSNAIYQSLLDNEGNLWVATNNGLAVKPVGKTAFELIDSVPGNLIRELHLAPDGRLLIGTEKGLYQQIDTFRFERYLPELNASISTIHHSPAGHLWLGTYRRGVWRYTGESLESLTVDTGLPNNHVLDIQNDHEGSIWVSTHGGLVQFRDALFKTYQSEHGLAGNYVRTVYEWNDAIFVGSSSGVSRIKNGKAEAIGMNTALAGQSVLSFAEHRGNLVIGTYTGGAFVWDGQRIIKHYNQQNGLRSDEVRQIAAHDEYGLFLGGPAGVTHVTDSGVNYLTTEDGLKNNYTTALAFDGNDTLWSGSVSGLVAVTIDADQSGFDYQVNGIDLSALNNAELIFQVQEYGGYIWFASDRGLIAHKAGTDSWRIFNRDQGLPFDNFLSVAFDGEANLWLGSNRGAIFIPHDAFTKTLNNPTAPLDYQRYTEVDGMSNSQVNSGGPSLFRSSEGNVWFATATGVSVIDPEALTNMAATPPPTVIDSVEADGKSIDYGQQIAADTQRISFNYAGLGYLMSDHIQYQVRLVGFDDDWVDKGQTTSTEYTTLPANDYLFQVRSSYPGGGWSEPANFAFSRSENFWQRPITWFFVALAIALVALIFVRARIRFLNRSRRQLEHMVSEKTAELEAIARQDPLTGLGNRRAFDERLRLEMKRSSRSGSDLSLAIIDVDFFKQINDQFLHTVGDQVLIELARLLRRVLRDVDYTARWGGEEFAILMPDTDLEQALEAAERARIAVERHDFSSLIDDTALSISIGVASNQHHPDHSSLLVASDQALYLAKANGRNRTEYK